MTIGEGSLTLCSQVITFIKEMKSNERKQKIYYVLEFFYKGKGSKSGEILGYLEVKCFLPKVGGKCLLYITSIFFMNKTQEHTVSVITNHFLRK